MAEEPVEYTATLEALQSNEPRDALRGISNPMRTIFSEPERSAARGPHAQWPATPTFGPISGRSWGALLRTHLDHHLRQFGD